MSVHIVSSMDKLWIWGIFFKNFMNKEEFLRKYYTNWNVWLESITLGDISEWIENLKWKTDDTSLEIIAKRKTDLYAFYISLVEIFIINHLVIKEENLEFFFEENPHNRITSYLANKSKFESLVNFCFTIDLWFLVNQDQTIQQYKEFIRFSFENYKEDFKFLNAYKHWRRILPFWKESSSEKGDSLIFFYQKKRNSSSLYSCEIWFNWEDIFFATYFLIDSIDNMRRLYLWEDATTSYATLDNSSFSRINSIYRNESEILSSIA